MWIKCHKKILDWSRLSTNRQACDYLTGGNTQTQTWGMSVRCTLRIVLFESFISVEIKLFCFISVVVGFSVIYN